MELKEKIIQLKEEVSKYPNVKIVAATKYLDVEKTKELVDAGITDLGENRTDVFLEKYNALNDSNITWHFFGVVQSRKIRDIANRIDYLHSLDKISTAMEIDKRLTDDLKCFVQVNISEEANKSGVPISKVKTLIKGLSKCKHIKVVGLMCIAKLTINEEELARSFKKMQMLKEEIENMNLDYAPCHELSMGMSNDYKIALKYGSTCIRLGRYFLD